jgi:hypothetical protein
VGSNNDYIVTHGCDGSQSCSLSTVDVFQISTQTLTLKDLTAQFGVFAKTFSGSPEYSNMVTVSYGKYLVLINWFRQLDQSPAIPVFDTITGTWAVYSTTIPATSSASFSQSFFFFDSVVLAVRDLTVTAYGSLPGFSSTPLLTLPATACQATLAGSSLRGSTACSSCGDGRYASQDASSRACVDCTAGTFAQGAASTCLACGGGTWSISAKSSCFTCQPGFPGPACTACQPGSEVARELIASRVFVFQQLNTFSVVLHGLTSVACVGFVFVSCDFFCLFLFLFLFVLVCVCVCMCATVALVCVCQCE